MLRFTVVLIAYTWLSLLACAQGSGAAALPSPYYVYPRTGSQHIALDSWEITHRDVPISSTLELLGGSAWIAVKEPGSIQSALHRAGKLPDPYAGLNSEQYRWVEEKAWYYRSFVKLPADLAGKKLTLCFDGIDYFAKIGVNGKLAGSHEGMLGGPYLDATGFLEAGRENEVIVEVRAANWGRRA